MKKSFQVLAVFFMLCTLLLSNAALADNPSGRRLFVHLDRAYYAPGEALWFCAYMKNTDFNPQSTLENSIYVELVDDKGKTVSSSNVIAGETYLNGKIYPGVLFLESNLKADFYTFMAKSSNDSDSPVLFSQEISVCSCDSDPVESPEYEASVCPESGKYFAGNTAYIAYNTGFSSSSRLLDSKGKQIGERIRTIQAGTGVLSFVPEPGEKYFFNVDSLNIGGNYGGFSIENAKFALPQASEKGCSIHVKTLSHAVFINVNTRHAGASGKYSLELVNNSTKRKLADIESGLQQDVVIRLPRQKLAGGFNYVSLINGKGEIEAYREFYVYRLASERLDCKIATTLKPIGKRSAAGLEIELNDASGNPVDAVFSISVLDDIFPEISQKGNIEYDNLDDFYFNEGLPLTERRDALDALMVFGEAGVKGYYYGCKEEAYIADAQTSKVLASVKKEWRKENKDGNSTYLQGGKSQERPVDESIQVLDHICNLYSSFFYENGMMYNKVAGYVNRSGEGYQPVALIVNGVQEYSWSILENLTMESVQIKDISSSASGLYRNSGGGYVSLVITSGASLTAQTRDKEELLRTEGPAFDFYSPRYDIEKISCKYDGRNTLYWNPTVRTVDGKASVAFCTNDSDDTRAYVVVNGVARDGRQFHWEGIVFE